MKPSKLDTNQIVKVLKAATYVAVSSLIGSLIVTTTSQPELFGVYTVFVNAMLVFVKQLFTPVEP